MDRAKVKAIRNALCEVMRSWRDERLEGRLGVARNAKRFEPLLVSMKFTILGNIWLRAMALGVGSIV